MKLADTSRRLQWPGTMVVFALVSLMATSLRADEVDELWKRVTAHYSGLPGYSDTVVMTGRSVVPGIENVTTEGRGRFIYRSPLDFALLNIDGHSLFRRGDLFQARLHHSGRSTSVYLRPEADWRTPQVSGVVGLHLDVFHLPAALLLNDGRFESLKELVGLTEGAKQWVIEATVDLQAYGVPGVGDARIVVNRDSMLISRIVIDQKEAVASMLGVTPEVSTVTFSFESVSTETVTNVPSLIPRPHDRRVTSLLPTPGHQESLVGLPAPALLGRDLEGHTWLQNRFAGRPILVEFWATWCGSCARSIPHLKTLAEKYSGSELAAVTVNMDTEQPISAVRKYLADRGVDLPTLYDPTNAVSAAYGVVGTPTFALIDSDGILRYLNSPGYWALEDGTIDEQLSKIVEAVPGQNSVRPEFKGLSASTQSHRRPPKLRQAGL